MGDQEYAKAFNRICHEYLAYGQSLDNEREPVTTGMSKQQRRETVAASTRLTGDGFQKIESEEEALNPPANFRPLHQQAMRFYQVQADLWHQWADSMTKGDRTAEEEVSEKLDTIPLAEYKKLRAEIEKVGAGSPRFRQMMAAIEQKEPMAGDVSTGPASFSGYLGAWSSICFTYYDVTQKARRSQHHPSHGMSEAEIHHLAAQDMSAGAQSMAGIADQERALQPPPELLALHKDTLAFYEEQSGIFKRFSAAIDPLDKPALSKVFREIDTRPKPLVQKIRDDVQKVAPKDKNMETAVEALERTVGVRRTAPN